MEQRRPLATTVEVATYLGIPKRTLDQWAYFGTGPVYSKVGRARRYRWDDIDRYVDAQAVKAGKPT